MSHSRSNPKGEKPSHFEVYLEGLCYMSVCTDMSPEEAEAHAQAVRPSGTKLGWRISKENFRTGETNPCKCNHHDDRIHLLFEC